MPSQVKGIVALFDRPDAVLKAAERTRDSGFTKWDVFTPFPVHGMDEAMGLGRSPVPWITFVMGAAGLCLGLGIQLFTMVHSWPQNYGGKPFLAWPAFVPITFETTVFLAGVSTALGALLIGGVLRPKKRVVDRAVTDDKFALFIEAADGKFDPESCREMLEKAGAMEVRLLEDES